MLKKRLTVEIEDELKRKFQEAVASFGGERRVTVNLVRWWISLSQKDRVFFMFPEIKAQETKRTDLGFKKGARNGIPAQ